METENRSENTNEHENAALLNRAPFSALDAAREALAAWQNEAREEIARAQNEVASTRAALGQTELHAAQLRDEVAHREAEATRLQNEIAATAAALELSRNALVQAQDELARERNEAARLQNEIAAATATLSQLQAENALRQSEAAQLRQEIERAGVALNATNEALASTRADLANTQTASDKAHADLANVQNELHRERAQVEEARLVAARHEQQAERAAREGSEHQKRADEACERLEVSERRRRQLQQDLLEVYADLRAEDLPSLILRVAMRLTGAENGLFADAQGTRAISSIGLNDLPKPIADALFDFTREAAKMEEPLVRNDSNELPDGANLINLAALPVAVMGDLRGVILVANKRNAPFDHDDTELLLSIGKHAGVAMENHRLHQELANAFVSTIAVLADAIEAKDPYTRGHCESVASVATEVAQRIGLSNERVENVRYAALLHDVGKIGVPDGILLKPGRLLPEEYSIIQKHSAIGRDLVSRVPSMGNIAPIILHHHERIDGSGYPDGLAGDNIPLEARIVGVIDAFDAMTTPRPYRDPVSSREAIEELQRCAHTQFDKHLVDMTAQVIEEREIALRDSASTSDS